MALPFRQRSLLDTVWNPLSGLVLILSQRPSCFVLELHCKGLPMKPTGDRTPQDEVKGKFDCHNPISQKPAELTEQFDKLEPRSAKPSSSGSFRPKVPFSSL